MPAVTGCRRTERVEAPGLRSARSEGVIFSRKARAAGPLNLEEG